LAKGPVVSAKLLFAMRAFVVKKMWYQAAKSNHAAHDKHGFIQVRCQHCDEAYDHQPVSKFSRFFDRQCKYLTTFSLAVSFSQSHVMMFLSVFPIPPYCSMDD
jgi:hypothetical protein